MRNKWRFISSHGASSKGSQKQFEAHASLKHASGTDGEFSCLSLNVKMIDLFLFEVRDTLDISRKL